MNSTASTTPNTATPAGSATARAARAAGREVTVTDGAGMDAALGAFLPV